MKYYNAKSMVQKIVPNILRVAALCKFNLHHNGETFSTLPVTLSRSHSAKNECLLIAVIDKTSRFSFFPADFFRYQSETKFKLYTHKHTDAKKKKTLLIDTMHNFLIYPVQKVLLFFF